MSDLSNIRSLARREFEVRVRTRSFLLGTAFLVIGVVAIAYLPLVIDRIQGDSAVRIAVFAPAAEGDSDPVQTLEAVLDPGSIGAPIPAPGAGPTYQVSRVSDLAAARAEADAGDGTAVLAMVRNSTGDLEFTLYSNDGPLGSTGQLIRQAATTIAITDRLQRLGVDPAQQAGLYAPVAYSTAWLDPERAGSANPDDLDSTYFLGFGMTILIFMMIILYGNWVAMSVVEEKQSRVMELILNAATPFQLLTGKVLGVGAVAAIQYVAVIVTGAAAILLQGPLSGLLDGAGGSGGVSLPEGLTVGLMLLFGLYGVLGFLLYAVLFAAAGSLVSRQEDVSQITLPMTMVASLGYFVAVWAATGQLDARSGLVTVLSQIPFISPFLMLSRAATGEVATWEVALSVVLLFVAIAVSLWIASRIYAAGVLLYGQRPSLRKIWQIARSGS